MSLEDLSPDAIQELAALSKRLSEDPSTRREFLQLTKKAYPDLSVPEIEMEEATNKRVSAAEQRVLDLEQKLRQKEIKEELSKRRESLRKAGKVQSDEEIQEIEKLMTEKGIANHETAADYWQWMKQTAEPTPTGYPQPVMSRLDVKGYMKNPVGAARENAAAALAELRKNPRPIGL